MRRIPMRPLFLLLAPLLSAANLGARSDAAAPITAAAITPDGQQVVLGSQQGLEVRSWPDLAAVATLPTELVHVHDLSFSPDGRTLLVAGGAPAELGLVELLGWPEGQRIACVAVHEDVVYRVAWSPDGTQWLTAGADGICHTIDAETHTPLVRYRGHSQAVLSARYLPDGKTVASVGLDQTMRLWDSAAGTSLRTLDNHLGAINDVAVRPGGAEPAGGIVATISEDRTVRIWQPAIGRLMRFVRLPSPPRALVWSAAGDRLFVGCNDGRIRVVDPETVEVVGQLEGLKGRIHELVLDEAAGRLLVAGESGCRSVDAAE